MKKLYLWLVIAILLLLTACQSSTEEKPILEETTDFDLTAAAEMIKPKEQLILDIAAKEKVSKSEYDKLGQSLEKQFGSRGSDLLSMIFIEDLDVGPEVDRSVNPDTFYPTILHEGVEVTKATEYKSEFETDLFDEHILTIREEYIGDDERLKSWNREYIFKTNEQGKWEFSGFSGVLNLSGDEYNWNYLKLKRGA
ncbi:hypothetical protein [Saccharibacillus sp. JS10]|uniref:hypothetical protein n=1 Tax=Saccharibacillus sp. JS10 TaxID=2950552 RepID=UPI00210863CE|nr:hypothetical protein [Saccharibacillus sp. JS10]MCQ4088393.1 hypothetical protein [Saccharibacillus sp. JS10]